jgi:transcriptional regulator with XRE-family HTH domain
MRVAEVTGGVIERTKNDESEFVQPLVLGDRLKEIRLSNNLTLADVAEMTGVARSTLSKIENHQLSPTFQVVQKLVEGLSIDIPQLFRAAPADAGGAARRTWTKSGEGVAHPTVTYEHELLCTDLTQRKMVPFKSRVRARSFDEFGDWVRHDGEEFLWVLKGPIAVYSEHYEPLSLETGDCMYFDSRMGHALVSVAEHDGEVLWVVAR